ncbi:uncharacterized protein LOC129793965 isoform X2 [Lutzomyia longipalpis]|nr:uncharacterized protein LOC129792174 isoform X2 [Lutzomyia longipalpis]XP_055690487.1 uncharacterized protein LOC129793965 isoform X2 [Lutzomyia longipalpis]
MVNGCMLVESKNLISSNAGNRMDANHANQADKTGNSFGPKSQSQISERKNSDNRKERSSLKRCRSSRNKFQDRRPVFVSTNEELERELSVRNENDVDEGPLLKKHKHGIERSQGGNQEVTQTSDQDEEYSFDNKNNQDYSASKVDKSYKIKSNNTTKSTAVSPNINREEKPVKEKPNGMRLTHDNNESEISKNHKHDMSPDLDFGEGPSWKYASSRTKGTFHHTTVAESTDEEPEDNLSLRSSRSVTPLLSKAENEIDWSNKSMPEMMLQILKYCASLHVMTEKILKTQEKLTKNSEDPCTPGVFERPLHTTEEVDDLEKNLNDKIFFNACVKELVKVTGTSGNKDGKQMAYKLLHKVFTCEVLTKFSWSGVSKTGQKKCFSKLENTIELFSTVARQADNRFSRIDAENFFKKNVLKHAQTRYERNKQ